MNLMTLNFLYTVLIVVSGPLIFFLQNLKAFHGPYFLYTDLIGVSGPLIFSCKI